MKGDICSAVFFMTYTKACKHMAQVQAPVYLQFISLPHAPGPSHHHWPVAGPTHHPRGGPANTNITQVTTEAPCKCNVSRSHIKKVKETGKINFNSIFDLTSHIQTLFQHAILLVLSFKIWVYFILIVHLSLDQPHFKCSIATYD